MEAKKRRKARGTAIIGRGAATVRIYPITRKDGYLQNTLCWKEGGRRRTRCFACMDEAKMVAQQISARLTNGWSLGDEVTRRDIEILRHCEGLVRSFGVQLVAAVEEWVSARKAAGKIPLADAVRFYQANRTDILPSKTVAEAAEEFVESLRNRGVSTGDWIATSICGEAHHRQSVFKIPGMLRGIFNKGRKLLALLFHRHRNPLGTAARRAMLALNNL